MDMTIEQEQNIRNIFYEIYREYNTESDLNQMYDDIRNLLCLELENRAEELGLDPDTVSY